MRYQRRDMSDFLRGPDMRRVCTLAAARKLAIARRYVGKVSGETAASGHLIHGRDPLDGRVRVTIAFSGVAVPEQFSNDQRPASRFLTRALMAE